MSWKRADQDRQRELELEPPRHVERRSEASETTIAISALLRICCEKLAETFLTPTDVAASFASSGILELVLCLERERLRAEWNSCSRRSCAVPRPWMTASPSPSDAASSRTSWTLCACGGLERDLAAALEVDPEVQALIREGADPDEDHDS